MVVDISNENNQFSSALIFILASVGSAVGLGNFWRFPYLLGMNGGGSFLIAYLVSVLIIGIPLMLLEISVGRNLRMPIIELYEKKCKQYSFLSYIPVLVGFVLFSVYLVIAGWTLYYFVSTLTGNFNTFDSFILTYDSVLFGILALILTAIPIHFGVKKGIEFVSKYMVPLLFFIAIGLVAYSFTLPGIDQALEFYTTIDINSLLSLNHWIVAMSQAIFSLSVGYSLLLTYAMYNDQKESILRDSLIISGLDILIAILAGIFIFSVVFTFGYEVGQGPALAFIVLVSIFEVMEFGQIIGTLFFLCLFLAALSSSISIFEYLLANFKKKLNLTRSKGVLILGSLVGLFMLPSALSYTPFQLKILDMLFLDAMDFYIVTLLTPLCVFSIVYMVYFLDKKVLVEEIDYGCNLKVAKYLYIWLKYVIPLIVIVLIANIILEYFL
jgi:neurotransmitter:Na+ symporter, NSS family